MSQHQALPEADSLSFPREATAAEVARRATEADRCFVFLPSIGWGHDLFQRPHHLARVLAQRGELVIFDCTGSNDLEHGFRELAPNLLIFAGDMQTLARLPRVVLWALPYNTHRCLEYPVETPVIYDWIDDLDVFRHDRDELERNHAWALEHAAVVASVARRLHEQVLTVRADGLYLPNGVELERFADSAVEPSSDPAIEALRGRPLAIYYGALASWFDYDLLADAARLRPDWSFLLIGPRYDDSSDGHRLFHQANVTWLGPRSYFSLPSYLARVDVALIPFQINAITLATSPLKLFEYMAARKPVISTPLPECQATPGVLTARDAAELASLLDGARELGRQASYQAAAMEVAAGASWRARVETALQQLEAAPPQTTAQRLARRFARLRRPGQEVFFSRVCARAAGGKQDDPCLEMYLDYALSTLERGRTTAQLVAAHRHLAGAHYLDVGSAYGGCLAAFAEQGAHAVGIEMHPGFFELGRVLLAELGVSVELVLGDASEPRSPFVGRFDIITANDVIEHVEHLDAFLQNLAAWLRPRGAIFLDIPNGAHPPHVVADGHYQMFGITLLDFPTASRYYDAVRGPGCHDTYNYLDPNQYRQRFAAAGLSFELLPRTLQTVDLAAIDRALTALLSARERGLPDVVPAAWHGPVTTALAGYLDAVASHPRQTPAERRALLEWIGPPVWKVAARHLPGNPVRQLSAEGAPVVTIS